MPATMLSRILIGFPLIALLAGGVGIAQAHQAGARCFSDPVGQLVILNTYAAYQALTS
jgi:hypothetical protein